MLVAGGDELEEQVRGVLLERQVADLIDDDQGVAAQPGQFPREMAVAVGVGQAGDPVGGGGEQDPVIALAGPDRQPDGEMGLAGSGRAEQHDIAGLGEERARGERGDLLADGGLGVEVERMGIAQGRVSAIEHAKPGTTELRTLAAYVEALGGAWRSSPTSATSGSPSPNAATNPPGDCPCQGRRVGLVSWWWRSRSRPEARASVVRRAGAGRRRAGSGRARRDLRRRGGQ